MKIFSLKYPLLFLLAINLFTNLSFSQSIYWQREYKGTAFFNIYGEGICKADSDNYFLLLRDYHNSNRPIVYKINSFGDTLFSAAYTNGVGYACVSSGDGGMVFSGLSSHPYSKKINSSCILMWDNLYNHCIYNSLTSSIIKTSDNFYILAGEGVIIKINNNGDYIWDKPNTTHYSTDYFNVVEAIDGGYIIGGEVYDGVGQPSLGLITKTDTAGAILWEKRYSIDRPDNGLLMLKVARLGNRYFTAGCSFSDAENRYITTVLTLDINGKVIDTLKYPFNIRYNYNLSDIKPLSDNRLVVLCYGFVGNYDTVVSTAFIIDTTGRLIRSQDYTANTEYTKLKSICVDSPNSILFIGVTDNMTPHSLCPFVIKTDSSLYAPPISVRNISQTVPDNFYLKQNYPNPFNNATQIVFGIKKKGMYNLKIYDVTGKLITELFNQSFEPGEYKTDFHADNLSSGVYFYKIQAGNYVQTKRMVLVK